MPNIQTIKKRIRSIDNITQITSAMEMVAASKMKRAQDNALKSRDYSRLANRILLLLKFLTTQKERGQSPHPLLKDYPESKEELLVLITSDKGLCGAYNTNLLKKVLFKIQQEPEKKFFFITIGKKGALFLNRYKLNLIADFQLPSYPSLNEIRPIVSLAQKGFLSAEYQKVWLAYTDFISILKQEPRLETIFPIPKELIRESQEVEKNDFFGGRQETDPASKEYQFEPSQNEVLEFILPKLVETQVFQAILESLASEHSARMIAMRNANENAKEMIEELTLTYNSVRQSTITQELAEINMGAEALS